MAERRKSKAVKAGSLQIGGGAHISVQSMLNIPAEDAAGNVRQAKALEDAGCEMVRLTVPNVEAARTLAAVKEAVSIPVVADIHFDYKCALESVAAGADKIRINPGNIGSPTASKRWRTPAGKKACPSASASIPGRSKKSCLQNTARPQRKRFVKAPSGTPRFWNAMILKTS